MLTFLLPGLILALFIGFGLFSFEKVEFFTTGIIFAVGVGMLITIAAVFIPVGSHEIKTVAVNSQTLASDSKYDVIVNKSIIINRNDTISYSTHERLEYRCTNDDPGWLIPPSWNRECYKVLYTDNPAVLARK